MTFNDLRKAVKEGKTIQLNLGGDVWVDWENPDFTADLEDYRIKETDND